MSRPVAWSFAAGGLQGWSAVGVAQATVTGGALSGAMANTTAWLESPPTWSNAFDAPIVQLRLQISQPLRVCVAWVVEYDSVWDDCTGSTAGKSLPLAVGVGSSAQALEEPFDPTLALPAHDPGRNLVAHGIAEHGRMTSARAHVLSYPLLDRFGPPRLVEEGDVLFPRQTHHDA